MVVWWTTQVEVESAIARAKRDAALSQSKTEDARENLRRITEGWAVVAPTDETHRLAIRLLYGHPLRAADSLQLAAALIWCRERPAGRNFISADKRLASAAQAEGFTVHLL